LKRQLVSLPLEMFFSLAGSLVYRRLALVDSWDDECRWRSRVFDDEHWRDVVSDGKKMFFVDTTLSDDENDW